MNTSRSSRFASILVRPSSRRLAAVACLVAMLAAAAAHATTYTATNTSDSGAGSLRQAMLQANADPGSTIAFSIAGIITPVSSLPPIDASGVTFDTSGNNVTLATGLSGSGGIAKLGAGVLTLSGTNTYTGTTAVSAGTLRVNGSIASASTVAVQTGGTIAGTGAIGGSMPVGDNAVMAPGNGGIGTLAVGEMTWHGSSTSVSTALFELGAAGASDRLAVTGFFNKGSGSTYRFDFGGTGATGSYTLVTFGSTTFTAADFTFTNLAPGLGGAFSLVGNTLVFNAAAPPVISSGTTASGGYGSFFSYSIVASNTPASYGVTGTLPAGVTLNSSTGVISGTPTQVGPFNVTISATNAGGTATQALALTIARGVVTPIVTVSDKPYDGSTNATIATRSLSGVVGADDVTLTGGTATFASAGAGSGKTVTVTGLSLAGAAAGNYSLSTTTATATASIGAVTAAITLGNLNQVYNGQPKTVTATASGGQPVSIDYLGLSGPPVNAGSYFIVASINAPNYTGRAQGTLVIAKAPAQVALGNLSQNANDAPHAVSVTTTPAGLSTTVTYDGASAAPTAPGTYAVVATITDPNYSGLATGTLTLTGNAPSISQQPVGGTVAAGGALSLMVQASANGGGSLRYQWQRNGQPISGATGATLALDGIRQDQAGSYAVVVSNDLGSTTSLAATVTVSSGNFAGVYFGTLGNGQGTWSMIVYGDGTGRLLFYVSNPHSGYVIPVTINADGDFSGSAPALAAGATVAAIADHPIAAAGGPNAVVSGRIVNGTVTGTTGPLGLSLQGAASAPNSAAASAASGSSSGTAPTTVNVIASGSQAFALVGSAGNFAAGMGTVGTGGALAVTLDNGAALSGTLLSGGALSGTLAQGGTATAFTGFDEHAGLVRRLVNVATRGPSGLGDNAMIAGFAIGGTGPKQVLIRAAGPALGALGVTGFLAQPTLQLFSGSTRLAQNQGWGTAANAADVATAAASAGAFAFAANSADSAILTSLNPGAYTAVAGGVNNTTGTTLIEVYEINAAGQSRLVNLSTRGTVGTGENVLIAGLVVGGNAPKQLLVRAIGPTLANFGVAGALADPQLRIMQGATQIATNDNWGGDAAAVAAAAQVAAFVLPAASRDSVVVITLAPGAYTAVVSGVGTATGVALVEVYELP